MQATKKLFKLRYLIPISFITSSTIFYPHFYFKSLEPSQHENDPDLTTGNPTFGQSIPNKKNAEKKEEKDDNTAENKIEKENESFSKDNIHKFISALLALDIDAERLTIDEDPKGELLSEYSVARHSYHEGVCPMVAFYPNSTQEVAKIMKLCYDYDIPVIGCGSGTNLEGSTIPSSRGVMIDFSLMNEIKKIYNEDFQVTVEPGVQWMELNKQLEKYNLFFPMDPGPGASIGGMINTNCSGTNAVRYGTMKDWIINLTIVLADGRIIKTANRPKKSSAGYNLNALFCGSEGTLGLVTEATLKVAPLERDFSVFSVAFEEIENAIKSSIEIIQAGLNPSCLEFMDDQQSKAINLTSSAYKLAEKQNLFIKVHGSDNSRLETINKIMEITFKNQGSNPQFALDKLEAETLWNLRKKALLSTNQLKSNSRIYITDVCVPISKLGTSIKEAKKLLDEYNLLATIVGHVGDGNYHLFIVVDPLNKEEINKIKEMHEKLIINAINLEGTCTGEHGIGMGKRKFLLQEKTPETIQLMKEIKKTMDPKGLLNQGKIFLD